MKAFARTVGFLIGCIVFLLSNAAWADLTVGNYTMISSKRVSRVEYEYTYRADLTNSGDAVKNVMAQVTSSSPYTTVVEGNLEFGDVASGDTVTSNDTFTIKQNRRYPLNWSDLVWDLYYGDAVEMVTPEGGVVEVTDPDSPIYRAKVEISPNAVEQDTLIIINMSESPDDLPGECIAAGEYIDFEPDGTLFLAPITISLPYRDNDSDGLVAVSYTHLRAHET